MNKSEVLGQPCPICFKDRFYKTEQGAEKGKDKPCKSCSNSIKAGGAGAVGVCIDCKQKRTASYSSSFCRECHKKRSSDYHRDVYRYRKYGITREKFDEMYDGHCHICCSPVERDCHIDHCHDTGKVRGLLCATCNKGLGLFKDSVPNLKAAINYLRRANEN